MPAFARITVTLIVAACLVMSASPAAAANQGVRAKALHQTSVYEGYYTVVHFEYQCPAASTATVLASITQQKTGAYYDSTSTAERPPTLICDGTKHVDRIGLVSLGYTEDDAVNYDKPYLGDTALGAGRGTVVITITSGSRSATDSTRVDVQNRDV